MKKESTNRNSFNIMIPSSIWFSVALNSSEKIILTEIYNLEKIRGECFAQNCHFAKILNLSNSRVSQILGGLKKKGFITNKIVNRNTKDQIRNLSIIKSKFFKANGSHKITKGGVKNPNPPLKNSHNKIQSLNKSDNKKERSFSEADIELSNFFYSIILALNPKHKKPNFQIWAKDISNIISKSNRSHSELKELIVFSNASEYWQSIILSPEKLRKHIDTLTIQSNQSKRNSNETSIQNFPVADDTLSRIRQKREELSKNRL